MTQAPEAAPEQAKTLTFGDFEFKMELDVDLPEDAHHLQQQQQLKSVLLIDAFRDVTERRWAGMRSQADRTYQLRQALTTLCRVMGGDADSLTVAQVKRDHLVKCIDFWRSTVSPSTINKRLSVLRALGIDVEGLWVTNKLPLKWWLTPSACTRLLAYLREGQFEPFLHAHLLADYIELVSLTGLRVEEAIRLKWGELDLRISTTPEGKTVSRSKMTVPGTKTSGAQQTNAIALIPALLLMRMDQERTDRSPEALVFPIGYNTLQRAWDQARLWLGVQDNKMATLKALRRTAARNLTVNGMPTEMLRAYLRHSNIQTTMGYLRLVGGYSTEEQHRWLD